MEKIIHKELRYLKVNGEWFNITPENAKLELIHLKIKYDDNEYLKLHI